MGKGTIFTEVDAAGHGRPPQHAIDLGEGIQPDPFRLRATFGQLPQGGATSSGLDKGGGRAGRLLVRTAAHATRAFGIEDGGIHQEFDQRIEVAEQVDAVSTSGLVRVHEVKPESLPHTGELCAARHPMRVAARR